MEIKRHIIATSGGFGIEPENKKMDLYILSLCNSDNPRICFLPTASGDDKNYIERFYGFFNKENCKPSHLSLFRGNISNIENHLLEQDVIYVGGGNTRNMMAIWKDRGVDEMLKNGYGKGIIMAGISAGSLCWYEEGITDSIPGKYTRMECLGFLKGSNCPFADKGKKETYIKMIEEGEMKEGVATEIGVGVHYENEKIKCIFASRENAKAYLISMGGIVKKINPTYLYKL